MKKKQKGYVALISIMIIGSIGLVIVISMITLGLDFSRTSFSLEQGIQARQLADACAENALQEIWKQDSFEGNFNMGFEKGDCSYNVLGTNDSKTINVTATVGSNIKKLVVIVNGLHPNLGVVSWNEVENF